MLVLVLHQGVYSGMAEGFLQQSLRKGRSAMRRKERRKDQVTWQREYGRGDEGVVQCTCTVLYKTGRKDCNSQRSPRCKELEGKCMADFNAHCYPFHVRLVLNLALGTHVEAKMFTFNLGCSHVIFIKCLI